MYRCVALTLLAMTLFDTSAARAAEITLTAPGGIRDALQRMVPGR